MGGPQRSEFPILHESVLPPVVISSQVHVVRVDRFQGFQQWAVWEFQSYRMDSMTTLPLASITATEIIA